MRDIDIRRLLRSDERIHGNEPDTLVIEEFGLCQGLARVDIAVVNGNIHGYEIKSEKDTLERLPGQVAIYSRVLDYVTLVVSQKHGDRVLRQIPVWWGIWVAEQADEKIELREQRHPEPNPAVDSFALAQLLWREEALQVLVDLGLASGVRNASRKDMWKRLASALTAPELAEIVRERIKNRGPSWRVAWPQV